MYVTDKEAGVNLLSTGIHLRGNQVALTDKNPFLNLGFENIETTRFFSRNIPLSYDKKEIEKSLKGKGVCICYGTCSTQEHKRQQES